MSSPTISQEDDFMRRIPSFMRSTTLVRTSPLDSPHLTQISIRLMVADTVLRHLRSISTATTLPSLSDFMNL